MASYRCYVLDAEDYIVQAHDLDCDDTAHAAMSARQLLARDPYHRSVEVWQSTQRVARLERSEA